MKRMAMVELSVPGSERSGRVYLESKLLDQVTIAQLEDHLQSRFLDADDLDRIALLQRLLAEHPSIEVAVFPSEESPPVYHAYVKDPADPESRLFACVLAPEPVVERMARDSREPVFETATLQVMPADATPTSMKSALASWSRRVWPSQAVPQLTVRQWPIEEVHTGIPAQLGTPTGFVPGNAPASLDESDYPLPEELSA